MTRPMLAARVRRCPLKGAKIVKTLVVSILALAASTAAALAGTSEASDTTLVAVSARAELTDVQMDQVKAGQTIDVLQVGGFSRCGFNCSSIDNNPSGGTSNGDNGGSSCGFNCH
jgi:hypothetical protein